ncbi:cation diffusion facilitator CzcD-associated flavoprotein CzcO [Novosphingobium hassiacum]|uniref:Cation diffusion facilitator CzcD-associated flavoprotein CzcO n=1 Tax=Novosphingobium hassiacum TaxID=173676 RepID=A0A7W5ZWR7_9SPHN|nr:NAD(P)/FAD-dependent oxidoreductase [Novosphingobium hassiacum]MBB3859260.1 cation diffusion facilitator CzcD-associated flavoprotein CzcO [Novosphingobium hassiacum]
MGVEQSIATAPDIDVLIVGAGISGIGMAAHMKMLCPDRSFTIVERRAQIGGTWDLFRYPGVRSDSDMHTLGFIFEPWKHEKSIADGPAILEYLNRIADERDIRRHIRFDSKVLSADFDSTAGYWVVTLQGEDGQRSRLTARWLYLGSGYYDYDKPYEAEFKGRENFKGEIVHPQFWPENLDYAGKQVVVIGSGATAVTIVPSMPEAAHVTMLQRTPTWYAIRPAKDGIANFLRKVLPEELAYRITRFKNVTMQNLVFKKARSQPQKVKDYLTNKLKEALGDKYDARTFTPPYDPWDQRLCLVPDGDLFEAIKAGRASIVTDHIDRFDATGIELKSGKHLDADVIITATGLKMVMAGNIAISVDGVPVDFADRYYYKGAMFSNVPNLAAVFGYLNASWTLRADINARYICDVLNKMKADGTQIAVPRLAPNHQLDEDDIYDFSSGYINRARHLLPKSASDMRWRLNQDYVRDNKWMRDDPIDDGVLEFGKARVAVQQEGQLEHAQ